ncbi:MAG: hypothetical protein M3R08_07410 [Bacteroidota bacterium]|nr:hypothetical protein [Bacteroidota bacterium]
MTIAMEGEHGAFGSQWLMIESILSISAFIWFVLRRVSEGASATAARPVVINSGKAAGSLQ